MHFCDFFIRLHWHVIGLRPNTMLYRRLSSITVRYSHAVTRILSAAAFLNENGDKKSRSPGANIHLGPCTFDVCKSMELLGTSSTFLLA